MRTVNSSDITTAHIFRRRSEPLTLIFASSGGLVFLHICFTLLFFFPLFAKLHLKHGQGCNDKQQDDGSGGASAVIEILVEGIINEYALGGGSAAGTS